MESKDKLLFENLTALTDPIFTYLQDLKVKTKYRYGITSKVFDLKTEIDIFKTAEAKIILSAELTHDVPTETYGLQYGVKSAVRLHFGLNFTTRRDLE